jgi:hypothetical protein
VVKKNSLCAGNGMTFIKLSWPILCMCSNKSVKDFKVVVLLYEVQFMGEVSHSVVCLENVF